MILSPRETGRYINRETQHIKCNPHGVNKVSELIHKAISKEGFNRNIWEASELNPRRSVGERAMIDWVFLIDTLNFSFWPDAGTVKYAVKDHRGKLQTGYWSLCAAVNRAMRVGIPVTDAEFLANCTMEQISTILKSDTEGEIPLIEERLKAINQAGKVLLEKFSGTFATCVREAEKDVEKLLDTIVDNFESYRDICEYKGKTISFLKRAQILASDVWTALDGKGLGEFHNINVITMFADYRVPQSLVAFNVLQYSEELKNKLKNKEDMAPGDVLECDVRGMSIYACDQIVQRVEELAMEDGQQIEVNAILVDYFLWGYARDNRALIEELPFHRCRTIYY